MASENLLTNYEQARTQWSDIHEHLTTFRQYAHECRHITEMGIRSVVSSWGFLLGLVEQKEKAVLIGVDLSHHSNIDALAKVALENGVQYQFIQGDSAKVDLEATDLLFIDTWHIYGHLKRELAKHHSKVRKYIIMHDTTVDEWEGESIRNWWDTQKQSRDTGYPEEEIRKGLWPAIEEFLQTHPEWILHERFTNNNGLTILKRISL